MFAKLAFRWQYPVERFCYSVIKSLPSEVDTKTQLLGLKALA